MVENMFDKAMARIDTEVNKFTKEAILDLLRCLLGHVDCSRILALYNIVTPFMDSTEHKEQKKAYKILEEICKMETEGGKEFLQNNLAGLQTLLLDSLSKTKHTSQYPRLKCLISILSKLQEAETSFTDACIPEAILCIKAHNKNARESAYMLLTCIAEAMIRWNPDNQDNAIRDFGGKLLSGLKEDVTTMHCSILAICKTYFHFKDVIPQDLTELILDNVLILMTSSNRQISTATLSFVKVFITSTPLSYSTKFLPNIMKGLTEMSEDTKRFTRIKTKFLLQRMSRKYGHDLVTSLVPKSDLTTHKRLKNIRKEGARKDREGDDGGDSGDDDDDQFNIIPGREKTMEELLADSSDDEFYDDEIENKAETKKKKSKAKKSEGAYIQEGDEVLDLLSSDAAQKITTTKPTSAAALEARQTKKKAKKDEFKMSSDGKLIISEDMLVDKGDSDSDDGNHNSKNKKNKNFAEGSDDEEDTFENLVATKKRKIGTESGSTKSRMSASTKAASSYKPGGSGIHRPLAPGSEYKSKKARGDVKLKGKPDPFAYIPMSHKSLNKRKAIALKKKSVFKSVIKAAKKGAVKGNKYKVKDVKKKMKS